LAVDDKNNISQPESVMGFTIGREEDDEVATYSEPTQKIPFKLQLPELKLPPLPKSILVPISIGVLITSLSLTGLLYFFHKATITLEQPSLKKSAEVTVVASNKPTDATQFELQETTTPFSSNEKKKQQVKRLGESRSDFSL
jgi:hypothetical protein